MTDITAVVPAGMFGPYGEDALTSAVRRIASAASSDSRGERAEKYGTTFENAVFAMRPFYWGECTCGYEDRAREWWESHDHARWDEWAAVNDHDPRCPIVLPNFEFKPSGFTLEWYKYIGRSMEPSVPLDDAQIAAMEAACMESLRRA